MNTFLKNKGNCRSLRVYRVSKIIYDITFLFTRRFLSPNDRTTDQMVQAARSGKQNIVEGSKAATTSMETQIKLTNVARASLQELLEDYEDYLRVRELVKWDKDSTKALQARRFCATHFDDAYYRRAVKERSDETVANIAIILIHQADVLLQGLINRQQSDFLAEGGIREQMSQARRQWRSSHGSSQTARSGQSARSSQSGQSEQSARSSQPSRQGSLTLAGNQPATPTAPAANVREQNRSAASVREQKLSAPSSPSVPSNNPKQQ